MTSELKTPLSIEHIACGTAGVEPFYWPVARRDIVSFRDTLIGRLVPLLDEAAMDKVPFAREARLLTLFLLSESMSLFQAVMLEQRLRRDGRSPLYGAGCRLWKAVFQGRKPEASPFLAQLAGAELVDRTRRKSPFRIFNKFFAFNKTAATNIPDVVPFSALRKQELPHISSCRPTHSFFVNGIVTTRRYDIIAMHAAACEQKVGYVSGKYWFTPQAVSNVTVDSSSSLFESIGDVFAQNCQEYGVLLPDAVRAYLLEQMNQACGLVAAHLTRLSERDIGLPLRLWTGSGGDIWDRMLRLAVRERGGEVTGHDHALGDSYLQWQQSFFLNEFFECDAFVTYTQKQRDLLVEQIQQSPPLAGNAPSIESVAWPVGKSAADVYATFAVPKHVRRIMLVGAFYIGEHARVYPLLPDVVAIDFQARLLAKLRSWGFEVVFKEHPESLARAPREFENVIGARNVNTRFEQAIEDADVLLFSYLRTSTFNITMRTNKPMVFIDFCDDIFSENARDLLAGRCPFVSAGVSPENRVVIDWDQLRDAIHESPRLADDKRFFERYLLDK